jgi:hypothetical protein
MALAEFQHCPACERPRGDVGISQRCPDCTCPPEDDLLIIRQSRPSAHALTLAGVVLFVLAVPGMPVGRWPALALLAMGASLIGIRMLIVRRSPRAVLWAEGFCLISWENPPRAFEWQSFGGVEVSEPDRAIRLTPAGDGVMTEIPITFFGTAHRANRFAEAATRLMPR